MTNGQRIILLRVFASTLISMTALICATWLMNRGILIPTEFWIIAVLAVAGVAGADVLAALIQAKRGSAVNDNRT